MRKVISLLALIILFSSSCEKEETTFPVSLVPPTIHGYYVTDDFGLFIKLIGAADMKDYDHRLDTVPLSNYIRLNLYPNPCTGYINIDVGGQGIMKKIWIVPARASEGLPGYLNANFLVVRGQPIFTEETDYHLLGIDLSSYKYNYFRVYVKIGDILLWNNIAKQ